MQSRESWVKYPYSLGRKNNFWYPHIGKPIRHLFRVESIDRQGRQDQKCQILTPKILILGAKSIFLGLRFLSTMHITNTPRATIFPLDPLRFYFIFEVRVVFQGSSWILAIFGEWRDRRANTPNFGPRSTKLTAYFNFLKILMVIEGFWVRARNDGGMAFFPKEKWPKIDFF